MFLSRTFLHQVAVALVVAGATAGRLRGDDPPPPEVAALLRRNLEAVGGETAVRQQTLRVARGTFIIKAAGLSPKITTIAKAPNLLLQAFDIPKIGMEVVGFDGHRGWSKMPDGVVQDLKADALRSMQRDADFFRYYEIPRVLKDLKVIPGKTLNGVELTGIAGVNADGKLERIYLAKDTALLREWDMDVYNGRVFEAGAIFFDEYREVSGGVKLPYHIYGDEPPAAAFDFRASEYQFGGSLPDERFQKPPGK